MSLPDYYAVLEVSPTADANSIRTAFRQMAIKYHPDRGGSHRKMVMINEAFFILGEPGRRSEYDKARSLNASSAIVSVAAANSEKARQEGESYPGKWKDFSSWADRLERDFQSAKFSKVDLPLPFVSFPLVDKSISGFVFISVGALFGVLTGVVIFFLFELNEVYRLDRDNWNRTIRVLFMIGLVSAAGGAWLGRMLHAIISEVVKRDNSSVSPQVNPVVRPDQPISQGTVSMPIIEACSNCGQRLRRPKTKSRLIITCPKCGFRFETD